MLQQLIPVVEQITRHPETFADAVSSSTSISSHPLADATKTLYQLAKKSEPKKTSALDSLLLDGFDQEQIWEQIQLFNIPTLKYIDRQVTSLQKKSTSLSSSSSSSSSSPLGLQVDDDNEPARKKFKGSSKESADDLLLLGDDDDEGDDDDDEEDDDMDDDEENASGISGDEDEDGGEEDEDEEEGEGDEEGEGEGNERFTMDELDDFAERELEADEELEELLGRADFDDGDGKKKKRNRNVLESSSDEEDDEDEEENDELEDGVNADGDMDDKDFEDENEKDNENEDNGPKSRFESEMSDMKNKIKELEDAAVAPKAWTMVGEASYRDRPTNSLLAEDLFFDYAAKPPPVITQERTASLEDIIKQRITKGTWDDVIRKKETEVVHKPTVELDSTKNTEGLAKVYEQQYLKTVHGVETENVMGQQYSEIESLFKEVSMKLDALSHFHFTPKPVLAEASIKAKNAAATPATSVEEITPTTAGVTGTTPALVAPQEVFHAPSAYSLKDKEELSKTERKAHRRHRKEAAVKKKQETSILNHEKGATDSSQPSNGKRKSEAIKELKKNKNVTLIDSSAPTQKTSSAKFFGQLQQTNTENGTNSQGKRTPSSLSSKAFKL